ncbi:hypothetical protein PIB30_114000, partial [Stylosanthes scabra]|nr:hypothetical protein [Stylosanthes scabra]
PTAPYWTGFDGPNCFWGGLGYDETTDDFLVVVGWRSSGNKNQWHYFSVRTNSWKEIEVSHLPPHEPNTYCAVFCNGAIHWLAWKGPDVGITIVAFDVARKHLSMMSLPMVSLRDIQGCPKRMLNLFGGCLGISYRTKDRKAGLWVMKEYNVESSWTKLNVVLPGDDVIYFLLCFTNGGEFVGMQFNN